MSTSPQELFAFAKSQENLHGFEAARRAVISRAYYAAFHFCRSYHSNLRQPGSVGMANGTHEQLISQLSNPYPKLDTEIKLESIAIGKLLRLLCNQRVDSDYKLYLDISHHMVADAICIAETLFEKGATPSA